MPTLTKEEVANIIRREMISAQTGCLNARCSDTQRWTKIFLLVFGRMPNGNGDPAWDELLGSNGYSGLQIALHP